ncbi:hypothetical protein Tdes44962_MAKER09756 [Teratosphaeria destructans]|uniref:Uncharacterized protein n=1 Tax=Teratosphaeria destructans TaxID=418781 RepID=A0A9W7W245_9PEZI|nr:hypothetical protein Tdes44962_MAKER09756 [Teratosphaeria destructans]
MQAAALLATDTSRDFSRNRATVSLYGGSSPSSKRKCTWRRFVSLSSDAQHTAQTSINDNWHPPDSLEELAMVVSTQLPLDLKTKIPAYHDIQPEIRKLEEETSRTSEAVDSSIGIPYREFVSFLTAIMSIRHPDTATDGSGEEKSWPEIDSDADGGVVDALVRAILERGGIHAKGKDVGFEEYVAFCDRYVSPPLFIAIDCHREQTAYAHIPSPPRPSASTRKSPPSGKLCSSLQALDNRKTIRPISSRVPIHPPPCSKPSPSSPLSTSTSSKAN